MNLIEQLKRHEGLSLSPYLDTVGKRTIGYGRNLDDVGISEEEAELFLINDISKVKEQLKRRLPWHLKISLPRMAVMENMAFNLGIAGLLKFKKFLLAAESGDYEKASVEMLDSKWATQVGKRADELSKQMLTGDWQ